MMMTISYPSSLFLFSHPSCIYMIYLYFTISFPASFIYFDMSNGAKIRQ